MIICAYFIDILQGNVETHLRCGGICNNHVIANCLQSSDDSVYRKYRYIVFDIDISYHIVEKILNFSIYRDTF